MATVLSRNSSGLVKCWRTNKRLGAGFKWMMIILGPLDHVIDDNDVLFVVVNLTYLFSNMYNSERGGDVLEFAGHQGEF